MTHWTDGPIAAFDLETTSVEVETARIVTFCVGFQDAQGWRTIEGLVNPGVPISEEATKVHGITTAHAEAAGKSPSIAATQIQFALRAAWDRGAPLVVYNAVFDLTILDRELRRHGHGPLQISGPVIDPLVLDKAVDTYRKGSRRLTDVCVRYGVTLTEEDAHSAAGDAKAALELAVKMADCLIPTATEDRLKDLSFADLFRLQQGWYRDQRLSFNAYLQRQGKSPDSDNLVWPMAPYNGEAT